MTIAAILSTKGGDVATVDSAVRLAQAVVQLADKRIGALVERSLASSRNAISSPASASAGRQRSTSRCRRR